MKEDGGFGKQWFFVGNFSPGFLGVIFGDSLQKAVLMRLKCIVDIVDP